MVKRSDPILRAPVVLIITQIPETHDTAHSSIWEQGSHLLLEVPIANGLGNLTRYRAAERTDSVQQSSQVPQHKRGGEPD